PTSAGEATRPRRQAHPRRARRFPRRAHRQPHALPPLRNVPYHRSLRSRFSPRTHPSRPRPRLIFELFPSLEFPERCNVSAPNTIYLITLTPGSAAAYHLGVAAFWTPAALVLGERITVVFSNGPHHGCL